MKLTEIGNYLIDSTKVSAVGMKWSKEESYRVGFTVVVDGQKIEICGSKEEMRAARAKLINEMNR